MQGEYHWHKHDNDDEFFFVLDGHFIIDLRGSLDRPAAEQEGSSCRRASCIALARPIAR
jgi:mannose-6-phosphate isomerase-like protein (cupin superfamily)